MVNAGAHNTVDAQRHTGGALPCLSGIGVDGAHNTVNVRCVWKVALSSSSMVDVGACHTVDA